MSSELGGGAFGRKIKSKNQTLYKVGLNRGTYYQVQGSTDIFLRTSIIAKV